MKHQQQKIVERIRQWTEKMNREKRFYDANVRDLLQSAKEIDHVLSGLAYDFFVKEVDYVDIPVEDSISLAQEFLKEYDLYYRDDLFHNLWNFGAFQFSLASESRDCDDFQSIEDHEQACAGVKRGRKFIDLTFNHNITDAAYLVHEWFHINSLDQMENVDLKEEFFSELPSIYAELQFLVWLKDRGYLDKKIGMQDEVAIRRQTDAEIRRQIYLRMNNAKKCLHYFLVQSALYCSFLDDILLDDDDTILKISRERYLPYFSEQEFRKYSKAKFHPEKNLLYVFGTGLSFYLCHHQVPLPKVEFSYLLACDPDCSMEDVYESLGLPHDFTWTSVTEDALKGMEELLFPPQRKIESSHSTKK